MFGGKRVLLPGFGLPLYLDDDQKKKLFPTAMDYPPTYLPLTTLREFTMMNLMNQLTDKPKWDQKIEDPEIASKWREEALNIPDIDMSEQMVDYCIAELRDKARLFQEYNAVSVFTGDVVKSDTIVPDSLRTTLIQTVKPLEDVPSKLQDWHPRSDDMVLDLVHPSLFPLLYGRSRVLPHGRTTLDDCIERCSQGEVLVVSPDRSAERRWGYEPYSDKFQWLPCEVDISNGDAKITSYINNLHPHQHKELYGLIEQVISAAIPLWNMTLSPSRGLYKKRICYSDEGYHSNPADWSAAEGPQQEDEDNHLERREYLRTHQVIQPEPGMFWPDHSDLHVDLRKEYAGTGLQVIVKLANIVLTPEKPKYGGGTWHIEGQLNEHICATALYDYHNENITPSHLAFRQRASEDDANGLGNSWDDDSTNHEDWLPQIFGCSNFESIVQDVGKIETKQGRLLTFPNILQHQVQPFQLADPTQPGDRKLLALFLVDPNLKIISTANVPCQRADWWRQAVHDGPEKARQVRIPIELQEHILDEVEEFPLSMEEAKDLRLELMDERSIFTTCLNDVFHSDQFLLGEH
ncbi:hypothetical protein BDN72DRAFT_958380 [Pluteus cervinus]|uniref:Uncharacterized protein n=1 Tax=Pluteus cervinus TaxID=181527 RepID=A0ACD3B033_9AGAR|nr:hypothetical protein BDN72DRAFT_958380 [Pluteus cervinus]